MVLRLTTSATLKERRLAQLQEARGDSAIDLPGVLADAEALGSLELAGFSFRWEEVRAARPEDPAAAPIVGWKRARVAVPAANPLDVVGVRSWHEAVLGAPSSWRSGERSRDGGPPAAPPAFIESRLQSLESWIGGESGSELRAPQAGALTLARLVEILPFEDGNGRVARLAAAHVMARAGAHRPILVGGDRKRLEAALQRAFQLDTEPLAQLLEEASERALDVMIQSLESPKAP